LFTELFNYTDSFLLTSAYTVKHLKEDTRHKFFPVLLAFLNADCMYVSLLLTW